MRNIIIDNHIHTNNSRDSFYSFASMCNEAINKGVSIITITDHCEVNEYIEEGYDKSIRNSIKEINEAKEMFHNQIEVLAGIELGQAIQDISAANDILKIENVDFILASVHNIKNMDDFYYMDYKEDTVYNILDIYFDEILKVIEWGNFDSLAHLTYPLRYILRNSSINIDISKCYNHIDIILKALVNNRKALEINTSGLRQQINTTLPNLDIIKRFRQFGGEFITIGSDAHKPEDIGKGIKEGISVAKEAGFSCITVYRNREPHRIEID